MSITIYGLDQDYSDCALEMGSKIYFHDGVIDCKFSDAVDISTDDTTVIWKIVLMVRECHWGLMSFSVFR